jgi:uncharacterized protein YjbI with pentapeptide repeats
MANPDHIAQLKKGVDTWNAWREENPGICPDLSGADLGKPVEVFRLPPEFKRGKENKENTGEREEKEWPGNPGGRMDLREANLDRANLSEADLIEADLNRAKRAFLMNVGAYLSEALKEKKENSGEWEEKEWPGNPGGPINLEKANLDRANLSGANLSGADLYEASLIAARLSKANLQGADLRTADLSGADLSGANLFEADLNIANLALANLSEAIISKVDLSQANLREANLGGATLIGTDLEWANLSRANLGGAYLSNATLKLANLRGANLKGANLREASLMYADLRMANLEGADLRNSLLINTDLTDADLTGCRIYGVSAWGVKLVGAKQQNLVITDQDEPEITVDNIEVAQFIYLLLHNEKIRDVIDTIGRKAVLILGRFTDKRKAVLDALREELRKRDYLPILFDFAVPATRDITETVSLLAHMARFIIADLTDPSSIPKELEAIVPSLAVPVQPLLEGSSRPYAMFKDYWKYEWVLPVYRYEGLESLLAKLAEKVIAPAEGKVKALQERRRMIEAELTKPQ